MSAAPANAPSICATMYQGTLAQGNPRRTAKAMVTAGLMCAPLIPPAT
jgi:TRAP-type C4-dicarboxylate transport system permease large subunit